MCSAPCALGNWHVLSIARDEFVFYSTLYLQMPICVLEESTNLALVEGERSAVVVSPRPLLPGHVMLATSSAFQVDDLHRLLPLLRQPTMQLDQARHPGDLVAAIAPTSDLCPLPRKQEVMTISRHEIHVSCLL